MAVTGTPKALSLILNERDRQREEEGFDSHRDDQYTDGELAQAGNCYRVLAEDPNAEQGDENPHVPSSWPAGWSYDWWKPTTRLSNLEKAGALYQAEIDRLLRLRNRVEQLIEKELSTAEVG